MAAPCKIYFSDNDVKKMFSLIANCAMSLCSRYQPYIYFSEIFHNINYLLMLLILQW